MDHKYVNHADCGTFETGVVFKTYNEKEYREARKQIFDLIEELGKSDISPNQKQRIIDGFKAATENPLAIAIIIEYFKNFIRLP